MRSRHVKMPVVRHMRKRERKKKSKIDRMKFLSHYDLFCLIDIINTCRKREMLSSTKSYSNTGHGREGEKTED